MLADGEGFFGKAGRAGASGLREPAPDRRAAHAAALSLVFPHPWNSAAQTLTAPQRRVFARGFAVLGTLGLAAPELLIGVAGLAGVAVFSAILVFRIFLYGAGLKTDVAPFAAAPDADEDWLVYTLLIALKDEAETAAPLMAAIRALDYPADRMDVKLLIETGDEATAFALRGQSWPGGRSCWWCRRACRAQSRAR